MKKNNERLVMPRDASFWVNPGRSGRYHIPRPGVKGPKGHPVAKCNKRIQLADEAAIPESAAGTLLCRKCKGLYA